MRLRPTKRLLPWHLHSIRHRCCSRHRRRRHLPLLHHHRHGHRVCTRQQRSCGHRLVPPLIARHVAMGCRQRQRLERRLRLQPLWSRHRGRGPGQPQGGRGRLHYVHRPWQLHNALGDWRGDEQGDGACRQRRGLNDAGLGGAGCCRGPGGASSSPGR